MGAVYGLVPQILYGCNRHGTLSSDVVAIETSLLGVLESLDSRQQSRHMRTASDRLLISCPTRRCRQRKMHLQPCVCPLNVRIVKAHRSNAGMNSCLWLPSHSRTGCGAHWLTTLCCSPKGVDAPTGTRPSKYITATCHKDDTSHINFVEIGRLLSSNSSEIPSSCDLK
jgi:hypothetical protein